MLAGLWKMYEYGARPAHFAPSRAAVQRRLELLGVRDCCSLAELTGANPLECPLHNSAKVASEPEQVERILYHPEKVQMWSQVLFTGAPGYAFDSLRQDFVRLIQEAALMWHHAAIKFYSRSFPSCQVPIATPLNGVLVLVRHGEKAC